MKKGWIEIAFTDVATLVRREILIEENGSYPEVGVRCFGKGLFHKLARTGLEVGDKKLFRLKEGDFILQVTFAWEGAVAIVGTEDEGFLGSVRVLTFEIDTAACDTRFLLWYFRTAAGVAQLAKISPGSAGRNKVLAIGRLGEIRIPLPPKLEQQRIVAHLDAIESRLTRVQDLQGEAHTEAQAFTVSLHHHLSKGRVRRLHDALRLDEEQESVAADGSYPQAGIRSFGAGMFRKPPTRGSDTTYRAFNVLREGKLVMSQVKGWEGAVAVCPPDLDGWFASPEYRTFACREGECDPDYLAHLVKTRWFQQQLASATRGVGARRERIRPEMLLGIEMPFPDMAGQKAALKSIEHLTQVHSLASQSAPHAEALLPSLLDRIFN